MGTRNLFSYILRGISLAAGVVAAGGLIHSGFITEIIMAAIIPGNQHPAVFAMLVVAMGTLLLMLAQIGMTIWCPCQHTALMSTTLLIGGWFICAAFAGVQLFTLSMWAGVSTIAFLLTVGFRRPDATAADTEVVQDEQH